MRYARRLPFVLGAIGAASIAAAALATACGVEAVNDAPVVDAAPTETPKHDASLPPDPEGVDGDVGNPKPLPDGGADTGTVEQPDTGADAGSFATETLATPGQIVAPSGLSTQAHVVYAVHAQRWWVFYVGDDAATKIHSRYSADFHTWTQGTDLAFVHPIGTRGESFSVDYADRGGNDVIHLAAGLTEEQTDGGVDQFLYHARGIVNGATIAWDDAVQLSKISRAAPGSEQPAGPSTTILSTGKVVDSAGWDYFGGLAGNTGNQQVYRFTNADTGANGPWPSAVGPREDVDSVGAAVNARVVVSTSTGLLALWEDGTSQQPGAQNVLWSVSTTAGVWPSTPHFAFGNFDQGFADWGVAHVSDTDIHLARRRAGSAGIYDYGRFDGTSLNSGPKPPDHGGLFDSGVAVLHGGGKVVLAAIDASAGNPVETCTLDLATKTWGTWSPLEQAVADRTRIAGWSSAEKNEGVVIWTETNAQSQTVIKGRRIPF